MDNHKLSKAKGVQGNFSKVYLLEDNKDKTLERAQLKVAADKITSAILLFPDPESNNVSSSNARKYKACFIRDGHWVRIGDKREEVSVGDVISNNKTSINAALTRLARLGINTSPLLSLPGDIHKHVLPAFHDTKSLCAFAQTSFLSNKLSEQELKKRIIEELLDHVIHGEQEDAKAYLENLVEIRSEIFPEIFETKMIVTDYSNRKIKGTAFQLALGAEDVGIQEGEECMAEMLVRFVREHIDLMPNGEAMLARQYREQFPDTEEAKAKDAKRIKDDADALHRMLDKLDPDKPGSVSKEECQAVIDIDEEIQNRLRKKINSSFRTMISRTQISETYNPAPLKAIEQAVLHADKDKFDEEFEQLKTYLQDNGIVQDAAFRFDALKALYQFRNHLESQTKKIIKDGKHFNAQLLVEAFKLYDENYKRFGNCEDDAKNSLSFCNIIGYIQRFVPACFAQAIHQGIYFIAEKRKKLRRLTVFKNDTSRKLLPIDSSSSWIPGYDYGVGIVGKGACWSVGPASGYSDWRYFKTYIEQKHQRCKAYANSLKFNQRIAPR